MNLQIKFKYFTKLLDITMLLNVNVLIRHTQILIITSKLANYNYFAVFQKNCS